MTADARHDILMITYNRPEYTRMTLENLLSTCDETMRVWIWHNGDHQPTLDVVKDLESHPRVHRVHISPENKGLNEPTNWFYRESDGAYLSKVDDDCLLPQGWGQTLIAAHEANPKLGVIGCWRFYDCDFVPKLANRKTIDLNGGHRLMVNCWTQGSGYVMKRECLKELSQLSSTMTFTDFCVQLALHGWTNGWYFPFIHEEHMDDPRSEYSGLKTEEDFMANRPLSAIRFNVQTLEEWKLRVRYMAQDCQAASTNPKMYLGWRLVGRKIKNRLMRAIGIHEPWRM